MAGVKKIHGKPTLEQVLNLYDGYLREDKESMIAASLGITLETLYIWVEKYPEFTTAKRMAEARKGKSSSFSAYVYDRLSPDAKKVWDQLQFWEGSESAYEKVNYILNGQPVRLRQELFIHALVSSNFDLSAACRMVCVPKYVLEGWRAKDLEFRQLVEEIQWHKKNFFEHALVDLVEERNPAAVIFANRTVNSDRGYSEKLQVEHSGNVGVVSYSIEDLAPYLDLETRRKYLEAVRMKKQEETQKVIEA